MELKLASRNCVKVSPSALVAVVPVEGLALGSYPLNRMLFLRQMSTRVWSKLSSFVSFAVCLLMMQTMLSLSVIKTTRLFFNWLYHKLKPKTIGKNSRKLIW